MNSVTQTQIDEIVKATTLAVPDPLVGEVNGMIAKWQKANRQTLILTPLAKALFERYQSIYKVGHHWGHMAQKRKEAWIAVAAEAMRLADIRQQEALESLLFLAQDALEKGDGALVCAKQVELACIKGLGGNADE